MSGYCSGFKTKAELEAHFERHGWVRYLRPRERRWPFLTDEEFRAHWISRGQDPDFETAFVEKQRGAP